MNAKFNIGDQVQLITPGADQAIYRVLETGLRHGTNGMIWIAAGKGTGRLVRTADVKLLALALDAAPAAKEAR